MTAAEIMRHLVGHEGKIVLPEDNRVMIWPTAYINNMGDPADTSPRASDVQHRLISAIQLALIIDIQNGGIAALEHSPVGQIIVIDMPKIV